MSLSAGAWGGAQADPAAMAAIASLSGPDRVKKLMEGARKEGSLNIYTSMPVDDAAALTSAFEQRYGVKSKVW